MKFETDVWKGLAVQQFITESGEYKSNGIVRANFVTNLREIQIIVVCRKM